jgi:penicillin-binding protein 1C
MSSGAAWIIHDILAKIPHRKNISSLVNQSTHYNSLLAWKTGTSYGFRDAWAIGMTTDYTIGIWTGRPDGTPVPGHYGAQTAVPLLQSVSRNLSILPSVPFILEKRPIKVSNEHHLSIFKKRPASVSQALICWPSGELVSNSDPKSCYKQQLSWILDETIPPVLAINPQLETVFNELKIISISHGSHIKKPEGMNTDLSINLEVQGGHGNIFWFINGQAVKLEATRAVLSYTFEQAGEYHISAIDKLGQMDQVTLFVHI